MGSFGTVGLMLGFFLIDRVGRRALVIASGVGTFASLVRPCVPCEQPRARERATL